MRQADPHVKSRPLSAGIALALALPAVISASAPAAAGAPELAASLSSAQVTVGATVAVTGRLTSAGQELAGVALVLEAAPYPFRGFAPVARATSAQDGSFSFAGIRPDRNTRLRVVSEGPQAVTGPVLAATVDPKVLGGARSLGPGRVRLTLRVRHAITADGGAVSVRWFLAARGSHVFRLAAVTASREVSPGVTYASVIVDPPVRRFVYRVCMNPPWERAMGPPATHRRCPEATFVVGRNAR
jgi:hypothetical protein